MSNTHSRTIPRRERGTLNVEFQVRFVERRYDACPRLYDGEYRPRHISGVPEDRYGLLDREPAVKDEVDLAHNNVQTKSGIYEQDYRHYYGPDTTYLLTCVNPTCPMRCWETVEFQYQTIAGVSPEKNFWQGTLQGQQVNEARQKVQQHLRGMANGDWNDLLKFSCLECGQQRPIFPVKDIEKKWIYVLKETGRTLQPVQEIYAETAMSGSINTVFQKGHFTPKSCRKYEGHLDIPDLTQHTWHFFLSPKKLGPIALDALCHLADLQALFDRARAAMAVDPDHCHVPVMSSLQPWAATVPRRFSRRQMEVPLGEYIPLIDPFSWAGSAVDADYMPILTAQRVFSLDENEQAKLFIARTLSQAISLPKKNAENNAPGDPYEIEDELRPAPPSYYGNVADAWIERYHALEKYLVKECNHAYRRVFYPVIFSPGHRIVEISCQEHAEETDFLAFGISHWLHLLSQAAFSYAGRCFLRMIATNEALDQWIPQKNVLRGDLLGADSSFVREQTATLPVQLYAFLAAASLRPSDVRNPSDAATQFKDHLNLIGLPAYTIGDKELELVEKTLDMKSKSVIEYLHSLDLKLAKAMATAVEKIPSDQMMDLGFAIKSAKTLTIFFGLLIRFTKWNEHRTLVPSDIEGLEAVKYLGECDQIITKFALEQWEGVLENRIKNIQGTRALLSAEEVAESAKLAIEIESTELTLTSVKSSIQMFAGPIGLVLGALDVMVETGYAIKSADAGDVGAAWGHTVIAAGAIVGTVALLTGAGTVWWVGPAGFVAAIVMAAGAIMVGIYSPNDLQMFARDCFLGRRTSESEARKGTHPPHSRRARLFLEQLALLHQRVALLRLLCNYTTGVVYDQNTVSCYIYPQLVPAGGIFEVTVEIRPCRSHEDNTGLIETLEEELFARLNQADVVHEVMSQSGGFQGNSYSSLIRTTQARDYSEVYTARILADRETFNWVGEQPASGSEVTFTRQANGEIKWINIIIVPRALVEVDTVMKSRLLLDPNGSFTVPPEGFQISSHFWSSPLMKRNRAK